MLRIFVGLLVLVAQSWSAFALPRPAQQALDYFHEYCPRLESEPDAVQRELEAKGWVKAASSDTKIRDNRTWLNPEDTISVGMQTYRYSEGYFFQCRITAIGAKLNFDPAEIAAEFNATDGDVEREADGKFTGIWLLEDKDFVSLNVIYDGKRLHLIQMRTRKN